MMSKKMQRKKNRPIELPDTEGLDLLVQDGVSYLVPRGQKGSPWERNLTLADFPIGKLFLSIVAMAAEVTGELNIGRLDYCQSFIKLENGGFELKVQFVPSEERIKEGAANEGLGNVRLGDLAA